MHNYMMFSSTETSRKPTILLLTTIMALPNVYAMKQSMIYCFSGDQRKKTTITGNGHWGRI